MDACISGLLKLVDYQRTTLVWSVAQLLSCISLLAHVCGGCASSALHLQCCSSGARCMAWCVKRAEDGALLTREQLAVSQSLCVDAGMTKDTRCVLAASRGAVQRARVSLCDALDVAYVLLLLYVTTMGQAHVAAAAILQHYKLRHVLCCWNMVDVTLYRFVHRHTSQHVLSA